MLGVGMISDGAMELSVHVTRKQSLQLGSEWKIQNTSVGVVGKEKVGCGEELISSARKQIANGGVTELRQVGR
jgi:hypothetical protein